MSNRPLESITAVVDCLPTHDPREKFEGLAYAVLPSGSLLEGSQHGIELQHSAQKRGSLYIIIPRTALDSNNVATKVPLRLQLPLTQTVFSTGLVSTLIHTTYNQDASNPSAQMRQLESHSLALPFTPQRLDFKVPLTLLTKPATVDYCMGNIVRKITPSTTEVSQPASQELEAAISSYFRSQDMPPEAVSVWALVMPANPEGKALPEKLQNMLYVASQMERDPTDRSYFRIDLLDSECVSELLDHGSRFYKVLSGGGGWGKKAGLLSLDPDTAYSTRELRGEQGWNFDFSDGSRADIQRQKEQALGQIVRKGETILFFLAPKDASSSAFVVPDDGSIGAQSESLQATFGALPSSLDNGANTEVEDDAIGFHENLFGALSEGGMALTLDQTQAEAGDAPSESVGKAGVQTKFDMPFSRIIAQEQGPNGRESVT